MAEAVWDDELTLELSRAVVERASPDELPVFEAIASGYAREGIEALPRSDGPLGFGVEVLTVSVVIVPVAQAVAKVLIAALPGLAVDVAAGPLKDRLKKLFRKKSQPTIAVPPAVVEDARLTAFTHARTLGLAEDQATLLADAVAGTLLPTPG